jgi:hypothetical protein
LQAFHVEMVSIERGFCDAPAALLRRVAAL